MASHYYFLFVLRRQISSRCRLLFLLKSIDLSAYKYFVFLAISSTLFLRFWASLCLALLYATKLLVSLKSLDFTLFIRLLNSALCDFM